ncbi:MAG: polyprenyl synthetase family protein, partial [Arcobacteraceae bacterium]|nr:polyprenyl synthetase family protein [Arcobacteraceae bacterium]
TAEDLRSGELLQIEKSISKQMDEKVYSKLIEKKTASLIATACELGAITTSENEADHNALKIFGKNLGIAFQMIDDILDITQDSATLGKPAMLDFVEGKVTIPYLLMWERLDSSDKLKLEGLYKKPLDEDELKWIKDNMNSTKALQDSMILASKFGTEAIEVIKDEDNEELKNIMKSMIERSF